MFEKVNDDILRLCIPFEDIYTSVFLMSENGKNILLDSGNSSYDAENYIVPALKKAGIIPHLLLLSHIHGDHAGGAEALLDYYPDLRLGLFDKDADYGKCILHFNDGDTLLNRYMLLNLKGHTADSMAVLDLQSKTLLSFDCLQLYGVGSYGTNFSSYNDYLSSIERVRRLGLNKIAASHAYEPLGYLACGEAEVNEYLDVCVNTAQELKAFAYKHLDFDPQKAAELYNKCSSRPPIPSEVIKNLNNYLKRGKQNESNTCKSR